MKKISILIYLFLVLILLFIVGCHNNRPPITPQCNDNIDNDNDAYIDYPDDPGCSSSQDYFEASRGNNRDSGCCEIFDASGIDRCVHNKRFNECRTNPNYNFYADTTCGASPCIPTLRITCFGDSNTYSIWQQNKPDGFPPYEGWCERLELQHGHNTTNLGIGAGTALPNVWGQFFGPSETGWFGAEMLDYSIDINANTVVMLFGLVDIKDLQATPQAIVAQYHVLVQNASIYGINAYVTTTPLVIPPGDVSLNNDINELNNLVRNEFSSYIELEAILDNSDYLSDGVHMNSQGQAKMAQAVADFLQ